jgi:uncharacterized protein YehS (DUF1456 family)
MDARGYGNVPEIGIISLINLNDYQSRNKKGSSPIYVNRVIIGRVFLLMNIKSLCQLFLDTEQLVIRKVVVVHRKISLIVESTSWKAICPECQTESTAVHSSYMRYPTDLAWADQMVVLNLKTKRFFCRNITCQKRTFAEQFPGILAPYARRTNRVVERQQRVSLNTCARAAEKLLDFEQIGISDSSVNRILRGLPEPDPQQIRVVGVDD